MEPIIQQITEKLIQKIVKRAYSGGISDLDALSSAVLGDCKEAAREMLEAITAQLNRQIRDDKGRRKAEGLVLKEKERPRSLLTELGRLEIPRDYYYDKNHKSYVFLLDQAIGIQGYERITDGVRAKLVGLATEVSYAKSAQIVTEGEVSRQSVRNCILKLGGIEKELEPGKPKRKVKELHVFADEDHVHLQKEGKTKGKRSQTVPLVTVTEGVEKEHEGRNRTKEAMHFVDEKFRTKELWKQVEGYLEATYDLESVERIYLHADGGKWIQKGLENFPKVIRMMDGFHLEQRLKEVARRFPNRNVRKRMKEAMKAGDQKKLEPILRGLWEAREEEKERKFVIELGKYLFGNYEAIRNRLNYGGVGSCTEGQISHVLSERFSRNPMGWSKEGLGKLSKQRVYRKNRGRIEAADFKRTQEKKNRYCEYAERVVEEACQGAVDFSLFERKSRPIFDGASGTQIQIRRLGTNRGILLS